MNSKKKTVLVIVAHPDDEVLGCGGTIASHCRANDDVHLLVIADGVTSRRYDPDEKVSRADELKRDHDAIVGRRQELLKSANILGVKPRNVYDMQLADQRLDQYPLLDVIKRIERIKNQVQPDIVYTHFWADLNIDHRIVCQEVLTAFRPSSSGGKTHVYHFEIPESTYLSIPERKNAFQPNHFVDISSTLASKVEALKAYQSEARDYPDMRSTQYIEELAKERARGKRFPLAEAFVEILD